VKQIRDDRLAQCLAQYPPGRCRADADIEALGCGKASNVLYYNLGGN
jgi:hypothetical protein